MRRLRSDLLRWLPLAAAGVALGTGGWLLFRDGEPDRPPLDLSGLRRRLRDAGGDGVEPRLLDEGIVELVGPVHRDELVPVLLGVASGTPGVGVVVNRLWSPSSSEGRVAPQPSTSPSTRN